MSMLPVLSGLRVIAVEQYGAGPYGSMQLADLGAEIIKIESPGDGGDMARRVGPFSPDGESLYWGAYAASTRQLRRSM